MINAHNNDMDLSMLDQIDFAYITCQMSGLSCNWVDRRPAPGHRTNLKAICIMNTRKCVLSGLPLSKYADIFTTTHDGPQRFLLLFLVSFK